MQFNREKIDSLKRRYPPGTQVEVISMNDPSAIPPGTIGEVDFVDDAGTLHTVWSNGRTLGLIPGEDSFRVIGRRRRESPPPAQSNVPTKNKRPYRTR